jgi:hypothetical protein
MLTKSTSDRFLISSKDFEPAYMALYRSGELRRRAEEALTRLSHCLVCPRLRRRHMAGRGGCKTGRYALA